MFLKNVAGQHVGFCLISVATGDGLAGLAPLVWVSKNGSHPALPMAGVVKDLGNGQYDYGPTQSESNCDQLSLIMTAPFAVPQEKTVFPFDSALPILGVFVSQTPSGPNFGPVSVLAVQNSDGLLWTNTGAGSAALRLQNAGPTQTGSLNTGAQTIKGPKTLEDTLTISPGSFGLPGIVLDSSPSSTASANWFLNPTGQFVAFGIGDSSNNNSAELQLFCQGTIGANSYLRASFSGTPVDARYGVIDHSGTPRIGDYANANGLSFAGGLYESGTISGLTVAQGGTGANLSSSGPGLIYQATPGGPFTEITPGSTGNVITDTGSGFASLPPSGSGPTIGNPVVGATPGQLLYVDGSGDLANSGQMTFPGFLFLQGTTGSEAALIEDASSTYSVVLGYGTGGGGSFAARFSDGVHNVAVCDGNNAIGYSAGGTAVWNGPAPTDVWAALDRLTAYLALNFPAFTPP